MTTTDKIEKQVTLKAPVSRVWRAIASAEEFGRWFGFTLVSRGSTAYPRTAGSARSA